MRNATFSFILLFLMGCFLPVGAWGQKPMLKEDSIKLSELWKKASKFSINNQISESIAAYEDYGKLSLSYGRLHGFYKAKTQIGNLTLHDLGKIEEARKIFESNLEGLSKIKRYDAINYVENLSFLGATYLMEYKPKESLKWLDKARDTCLKYYPDDYELSIIYAHYSNIYLNTVKENVDSALCYLEKSHKILKINSDGDEYNTDDARHYLNYGATILERKYRPLEALGYFKKVEDILKKLPERLKKDNYTIKIQQALYTNLGVCYQRLGELEKSLSYLYMNVNFAKKDIDVANRYKDLDGQYLEICSVYQKLNNLDSAKYFCNEAIKINDINGKHNIDTRIRMVHLQLNEDKYDDIGTNLYKIKKELNSLKLPKKHIYNAYWYNVNAELMHKKSNYQESLKYYQKSLTSIIPTFHDSLNIHHNPVMDSIKSLDDYVLVDILKQKCFVLFNLFQEKKEKIYYDSGLNTGLLAIQFAEKIKSNMSFENDKVLFLSRINDLYAKVIFETNELKDSEKSFYFTEKYKYFTLYENIQKRKNTNLAYPTMPQVQAKLQSTQVVLEYAYSQNTVLLFAISKDKTGVYDLQIKPDSLDNLVKLYLGTFDSPDNVSKERHLNTGAQLYQILLGEAAKQGFLKNNKHLIVIPQGGLSILPFEALLTEVPVKVQEAIKNYKNNTDKKTFPNLTYHTLPYLLKSQAISYYPSATLAFTENTTPAPTYQVDLYNFAPIFAGNPKPFSKNVPYIEQAFVGSVRGISKDSIGYLRYSEAEAKFLKKLYKDKNLTVMNEEATEANLKANITKARIVHLSTHSFANSKDSDKSGVIAYQPKEEGYTENMEDGVLYADEIYNMRLQPELLVLSSCQGGVGKYVAGEGVLALNRAFMYAGVENIVFSLWKVKDEQTSLMMQSFYAEMKNGKNYAEALRLAKLKILEGKTTSLPMYWAGFIINWKQ